MTRCQRHIVCLESHGLYLFLRYRQRFASTAAHFAASSHYLMHCPLQIRNTGCGFNGSQQQLNFAPRLQIRIAGCDHKGRQNQLVDARAASWPSPEREEAKGFAVWAPGLGVGG